MSMEEISINAPVEYLGAPDKSATDKKDYKCMILSNGLKVLLVSNRTGCSVSDGDDDNSINDDMANEEVSAVALLVDVGSSAQPSELQGLAHFLEHMIFMGSKKYPKENSFDTHITKYGGSSNACTGSEETLYYFKVPEKHLDSSMEYLAAQLKEPLLLQESMTREREAIESEYQLAVNNDNVRADHLLQSLANENYPHCNFTFGNLKSLKDDIESDEELHTNLIEFYKWHYSAHRMYACIQSCLPMQELESMALEHFGDISNNQLPGLDFSQYSFENAFKEEYFQEFFCVKPIKDVCFLKLTWVLPSTLKQYKCKAGDFLAHLLGYEGNGSLCAYLRKRLWALELMAGPIANSMFTLFSINIALTELGLQNLDEVLKVTFSYIKLFNKASELKEIYEEQSFIKSKGFDYAGEASADANVQYLVKCLKRYPVRDILTAPELYFEYNELEVQSLLDQLNQFHFNITLLSKQLYNDVVYDKREKWFGTEYTSKKIPKKWLEMWNNCLPMPELHLPQKNPFIAHDYSIFWIEEGRKKLTKSPEKIMQTETCELWFRQDDKFNLPNAGMYFCFISPLLRKNCKNSAICALYLDLVQHHLIAQLYPATMAGINSQIYYAEKVVIIAVEGYNEKLYLVVELLMDAFISTKDRISETELEVFKKQHQKDYLNSLLKPNIVNVDLQNYILEHTYWLLTDTYNHIKDISLSDIKLFMEGFTQELYVQALMQGNLQQQTAHTAMSRVIEYLNISSNIKEKSLMHDRTTKIPLGTNKILCQNLNPKDCNSAISNFYQIGPTSLRIECILNLINMILETPIYDTLRTKQQLGYYVNFRIQNTYCVVGYSIDIISRETKHSAHYVEQCIEDFRESITTILNELSLEDFENFKNSLIKLKEIKDVTIYDEMCRNWLEITGEEYIFERRHKEIAILHTLKKQDILEFWLKNETDNVRKLSVQVMGLKETTEASSETENAILNDDLELKFFDDDKDGTAIMQIVEFKDKLQVYPVIKTEV